MIAIVLAFEEPSDDSRSNQAIIETILEAAKPNLDGITKVKGYLASHEVADQVIALFPQKEE